MLNARRSHQIETTTTSDPASHKTVPAPADSALVVRDSHSGFHTRETCMKATMISVPPYAVIRDAADGAAALARSRITKAIATKSSCANVGSSHTLSVGICATVHTASAAKKQKPIRSLNRSLANGPGAGDLSVSCCI